MLSALFYLNLVRWDSVPQNGFCDIMSEREENTNLFVFDERRNY